jgi:hypothetical protein
MDKNVARASALLMVKDFGAREFSVTDKPFELVGFRGYFPGASGTL